MKCIKCKKDIPDDALFCQWCGKKQTAVTNNKKKRANGEGSVYKAKNRISRP